MIYPTHSLGYLYKVLGGDHELNRPFPQGKCGSCSTRQGVQMVRIIHYPAPLLDNQDVGNCRIFCFNSYRATNVLSSLLLFSQYFGVLLNMPRLYHVVVQASNTDKLDMSNILCSTTTPEDYVSRHLSIVIPPRKTGPGHHMKIKLQRF